MTTRETIEVNGVTFVRSDVVRTGQTYIKLVDGDPFVPDEFFVEEKDIELPERAYALVGRRGYKPYIRSSAGMWYRFGESSANEVFDAEYVKDKIRNEKFEVIYSGRS